MEFSYMTGRVKTGKTNLENNAAKSSKAEHIHTLWPINSIAGTYSAEMCTYLPKISYKNVHWKGGEEGRGEGKRMEVRERGRGIEGGGGKGGEARMWRNCNTCTFAGGDVKWYSCYRKMVWQAIPQNIKCRVTMISSNSTFEYMSRNESRESNRYQYTHVHSIIHNSLRGGSSLSVHWWVKGKQNVLHTCNGKFDTCYILVEPWKHYIK